MVPANRFVGRSLRSCTAIWGFVLWLSAAVAMIGLAPAAAQSPPEARDAAIDLWLSESEIAGLQALAALAKAGDAPSQLLLGLIDKDFALQGPALLSLPRAERLALLRVPGGMSGRSWLHAAAAQGDVRAQAWQALLSVDADLTTAKAFAALGEDRAAAQTLLTLVKRQETGFDAAVLAAPWYPQSLLYLSNDRTLAKADAARIHPGDPQHRYGPAGAPDPAALQAWLAQSSLGLHLRATCDAVCPESRGICAFGLFEAMGSYEHLLTHGSPVAALIPEARFATSRRGQTALARRIMLMRSTRMREAQRLDLAKVDACAADWLALQYDGYNLRKIPAPE